MLGWLATFLMIWFIYHVRSVFPPFVVGGIVAYLLLPLVHYVSTTAKIKRGQAVGIIYLGTAITVTFVCWFFLPTLTDQIASMAMHRHEIVTNIVRQAASTFHWDLDVELTTRQILNSIEESIGRPSEIVQLGGVVSRGMLNILVCIVSSIYFIVDSKRIGEFALRFVPEERRATVIILSSQMNQMLSRYVRGQLVLIIVMSSVAWLFLHYVIHLKYALVIALLSGFLEIIPVLGPILATTVATLVGFAQFSIMVAAGIIGFYTVARWMEDYLVVPKVIGHAVDLHPLIVIFAVLCGEVMAGALGMLIAIPVAASIKVIIDFTHPPNGKIKEATKMAEPPQAENA
jgi:predicted PurR-regulated permease PerM